MQQIAPSTSRAKQHRHPEQPQIVKPQPPGEEYGTWCRELAKTCGPEEREEALIRGLNQRS